MTGYTEYVEPDSPWLGAVPAHWRVSRFGYEAILNGGQVDPREDPWRSMVLVAPNHIESTTGRITGRETAAEQAADSGKYLAKAGQVLYSKIRPALNKVAIATEDCLCSADMYAMSFRPTVVTKFAFYYMLARPLHSFATVTSMRVKMPKINREELSAAPWLLPPPEEQRAIADFLDREAAKVDTLIAKQEQLIGNLRERRNAVLSAAFQGHPPTRLRRLVQPGRPMTYGILQACENITDGVPYIGPSDMPGRGQSPALADLRRTAHEISSAYTRSLLRPGDVVVSIGPAYGKVAMIAHELEGANLTQDTVRVACDAEVADPWYLVWALSAREAHDYWDSEIMGATFRRLNLGTLARTPIPLPSLDDQRRIAAYLDEQTAKIDALISKTERFIELAKERRTALITAAVTGQIDVRGAA